MNVVVAAATGAIGRRVSAELARSDEVTTLTLGGRSENRTAQLALALGGGRIASRLLELDDEATVRNLFSGTDVVISCAGPAYRFEAACARAAISAGAHYLSLADDEAPATEIIELDGAAVSAGVTVVSGCGLSPGITEWLIARAGEELESVHEIEVALAASSSDSDGPASVMHLLAALAASGAGAPRKLDATPRGGPKLVYFPEPIGWIETFHYAHPGAVTVPRLLPDVKAVSFRIGLSERVMMDLLRGMAASGAAATDRLRRWLVKAIWPVRPVLHLLPPRGVPWTSARVDVHGSVGSHQTTISLATLDRVANLASAALVETALALGGKTGSPTGVRSPHEILPARDALHRLTRRGLRFVKLEAEPL